MKKLIAIAAAAVFALGLAGCSSPQQSTPTEPETKETAQESIADPVVESGFFQSPSGGAYSSNELTVGITVENPNDTALANASFVITAKDADGNVVAADPEFKIGDLQPHEVFGLGVSLFLSDGAPAVESVSVAVNHDGPCDAAGTALEILNVNQTMFDVSLGSSQYLGEVANNGDDTHGAVMVGLIQRDASGNIVGGGFCDLNDLAPGTSPYDVYAFSAPESCATYEAYAHLYHA